LVPNGIVIFGRPIGVAEGAAAPLDDDDEDDDDDDDDEDDDEDDDDEDDVAEVAGFVCVPTDWGGATNFTRSPMGILSSPRRQTLLAPSVTLSQILYPSAHSADPRQVREQKPGPFGASAVLMHMP
jgi:hypothetical protein